MANSIQASTELDHALEAHRRELTGFCYRMLGSGSEAEDAVQETMVRAWRNLERFEGRSALRSWLYKIAHNVCVDMLRSPQRRARPMEMGPARSPLGLDPGAPLAESFFLQPIADAAVIDLDGDPAVVTAARETMRLAFVAALQHLPARQRAVLILCEVLRWSAAEVAALLEVSVASVNSALQRARATLARLELDPSTASMALDPLGSPGQQRLLDRYVAAFERYDIAELVTLVRHDVVMSMPPLALWLQGPEHMASWMLGQGIGCRGGRLLPVAINGTAGFGSYRQSSPGRWEPWAIQVIEVAGNVIVGHHNFLDPERFAAFGLPMSLEG